MNETWQNKETAFTQLVAVVAMDISPLLNPKKL